MDTTRIKETTLTFIKMLSSSNMKYIFAAVLILYSLTTFHMISWTFQIGAVKNKYPDEYIHEISADNGTYMRVTDFMDDIIVRTPKQKRTSLETKFETIDGGNHLEPYEDEGKETTEKSPALKSGMFVNSDKVESVAKVINGSSIITEKLGRKRKILSKLWHDYYRQKDEVNDKVIGDFQPVGNDIYVFSAFYDDRQKSEYTAAVVRVIAVSKIESEDTVVCSFTASRSDQWVLADRREMSDNHNRLYGGFMYLCNIPPTLGVLPDRVYVNTLNLLEQLHSKSSMTSLQVQRVPIGVTGSQNFEENFATVFGANKKLDYLNQDTDQNGGVDLDADKPRGTNAEIPSTHLLPKQQFQQGEELLVNNTTDSVTELPSMRKYSANSKKIAVCVPPIFGNTPLSNLIQFVEIHKLLGVGHFFFYQMNVTSDVAQILQHYKSKNIASIIPWLLPYAVRKFVWYNGQSAAIQDCLYRTMGHFDYVAFIDIDEIIVPKFHQNWTNMLEDIVKNSQTDTEEMGNIIGAFKFKSAYFDPEKTSSLTFDDTQASLTFEGEEKHHKLSHFRTLYRTAHISTVRTKVIVKPELVEEIGIHHVSSMLNATMYDIQTHEVAIETALIHHYRQCTIAMDTAMKCDKLVLDKSILKFENDVLRNFESVVNDNLRYLKNNYE